MAEAIHVDIPISARSSFSLAMVVQLKPVFMPVLRNLLNLSFIIKL